MTPSMPSLHSYPCSGFGSHQQTPKTLTPWLASNHDNAQNRQNLYQRIQNNTITQKPTLHMNHTLIKQDVLFPPTKLKTQSVPYINLNSQSALKQHQQSQLDFKSAEQDYKIQPQAARLTKFESNAQFDLRQQKMHQYRKDLE